MAREERNTSKKERARCLDILAQHKAELINKLLNSNLGTKQKLYLRHVIALLRKIEMEIMDINPSETTNTIQPIGDFSVEEMEKAQSIIEEQNQNPFEV